MEVSVVRGKWAWVGVSLLSVLIVLSFVAVSASSTRFKVGEDVVFRVDDSTTWYWGCCSCDETLILGWRVVTSTEQVIYSVVHDAPVPASVWLGTWSQVDAGGVAVPAGQFKLYVDTSVGTMSRCLAIVDPCARSWCSPCMSCVCEGVSTITTCACRASLVFVDSCQTGCFSFPLFWGWGCCGSPSCP